MHLVKNKVVIGKLTSHNIAVSGDYTQICKIYIQLVQQAAGFLLLAPWTAAITPAHHYISPLPLSFLLFVPQGGVRRTPFMPLSAFLPSSFLWSFFGVLSVAQWWSPGHEGGNGRKKGVGFWRQSGFADSFGLTQDRAQLLHARLCCCIDPLYGSAAGQVEQIKWKPAGQSATFTLLIRD